MRIKININLLSDNTMLPSISRSNILYIIKSGLEISNEQIKSKYYDENKNFRKPFTFSTYFRFKDNNTIENQFSLTISTNDYEFLISLYNGLLELSKSQNKPKLFNSDWQTSNYFLLPEVEFNENVVTFKTLSSSPIIIRDPDSLKKSKDEKKKIKYLYLADSCKNLKQNFSLWTAVDMEKLKNGIKLSIKGAAKKYLDLENLNGDVEITRIKTIPVKHGSENINHKFKQNFPGINCIITLKNYPPEVLKLIYDIGLGARCSEGFGMLEVVR